MEEVTGHQGEGVLQHPQDHLLGEDSWDVVPVARLEAFRALKLSTDWKILGS